VGFKEVVENGGDEWFRKETAKIEMVIVDFGKKNIIKI